MPDRRGGAPTLRRAAAQWPLLVAVLATLVACATLVGVATLVLTDGQHRALSAAVAEADGTGGSGSADLVSATLTIDRPVDGADEDTPGLVSTVVATMRDAVDPYAADVSVWAATPMLYLPGTDAGFAYLLDADTASARAALVSGRWPGASDGPTEVALPSNVATGLGLVPGDTLRLTTTPVHENAPAPDGVDLIVVGVFSPDLSPDWSRDVLGGAGIDPGWDRLPAYGPFVVASGTLARSDIALGRLSVVVDPDLAGDPDGLPSVVGEVRGLRTALLGGLSGRAESVIVSSGLGALLSSSRAEQSLTGSMVLTVALLVIVVGAASVALVGGLLIRRREGESVLLVDRGASRWQLAGRAGVEAIVLAAIAAAAAVPLAIAGYRGLTALPPFDGAWAPATLDPAPAATLSLLIAVAAGAFFPACVVVVAALRVRGAHRRRRVVGAVARSGADLMLVAIAVLGFLQLRSHRAGTGAADPVLVVAPVLCVVAGAALALRVLPLVSRVVEFRARRERGIVLPFAGWRVARGGATTGTFLVVLSAAAATFGVVFLGTWSNAQGDQAAVAVGADLRYESPGNAGTGSAIATATGGVVSPAAHRPVSLGARPGAAEIIALNTTVADELIRGRLNGDDTWGSLTAGLAPPTDVAGFVLDDPEATTATLAIEGHVDGSSVRNMVEIPAHLTITPTAVLEDAWGNRVSMVGWTVPADGVRHEVTIPAPGEDPLPAGAWTIVAIDLRLGLTVDGGLRPEYNDLIAADVAIEVEDASGGIGSWTAHDIGSQPPASVLSIDSGDATIDATIGIAVYYLVWSEAHVVLTGYETGAPVPVVVTDGLADELGLDTGDALTLRVGVTTLDATMAGRIPYAPGADGRDVVLADLDALTRARLATGDLTNLTDEWWVGDPSPDATVALDAAGIRPVETRAAYADRLRNGPLRAAIPVSLVILAAAAVALAIAGIAAQAAAAAQARAISAARLRGLGVSRRAVLATGILEHAWVTAVAVVVGAALGAVLARFVGPLLVIGEGGRPAVPAALVDWNGRVLAMTLGTLLFGGIAVGIPAARALVARATALSLRLGDTP